MPKISDTIRYASAWMDRAKFTFPTHVGKSVDTGAGLGSDALEPETELDFDKPTLEEEDQPE